MGRKHASFRTARTVILVVLSLLVGLAMHPATPRASSLATSSGASGDLVINEIDYDQLGTDTAEFIEIRNNGSSSVNLDSYHLDLVDGSGGGATLYKTIDLPDEDLAAGDCYVICGDATKVRGRCDLDVVPDTDLIQNGMPDAVALVLDSTIVDAVSYAGDTGAPYTEGSGARLTDNPALAGHGISRCFDGTDTDQNNVDFYFRTITPGTTNKCYGVFGYCGDPATFVHEIQGSGMTSPLDGEDGVIVEAVVVGDFQDTSSELGGFFIQEEDDDADANPPTSEGIFVYDNGFGTDVGPGDVVRLRGDVYEYNGLTELKSLDKLVVCSSGSSVEMSTLDLPVDAIIDLERYEGMLLTVPETLYVTEHFNLGRYGEVWVSAEDRLSQPTNVEAPGTTANNLQDLNDRSRLLIDDGSYIQNPVVVPHLASDNTLRLGDTVTGLTGVLSYDFAYYRLQPTVPPPFVRANDRTAAPDDPGDTLTVATFNLSNFFNGDGQLGGFPTSRGADSHSEFGRQESKLVTAILAMDADIIGVQEIENDGYGQYSAISDLAGSLTYAGGGVFYGFVDPGVPKIGSDEIAVGFIYNTGTVTPVGSAAILDSSVDPLFIDTKNRPALAQTFKHDPTGERLDVAVNHLKYKGSACDDVGDPDTGDGQGNCSQTRTKAAIALLNWLVTDATGSSDPDFLIIGDLNAYAMEDPITALKHSGYTDLVAHFVGKGAYAYVFDGQAGYLDHALASASLMPQVVGTTIWHINADELRVLDYNEEYGPSLPV